MCPHHPQSLSGTSLAEYDRGLGSETEGAAAGATAEGGSLTVVLAAQRQVLSRREITVNSRAATMSNINCECFINTYKIQGACNQPISIKNRSFHILKIYFGNSLLLFFSL